MNETPPKHRLLNEMAKLTLAALMGAGTIKAVDILTDDNTVRIEKHIHTINEQIIRIIPQAGEPKIQWDRDKIVSF